MIGKKIMDALARKMSARSKGHPEEHVKELDPDHDEDRKPPAHLEGGTGNSKKKAKLHPSEVKDEDEMPNDEELDEDVDLEKLDPKTKDHLRLKAIAAHVKKKSMRMI